MTLKSPTGLDNVRLSLKLKEPRSTTSAEQKEPFMLDLWKGFSKEIVLKIRTIEEVPEEEYGPYFWFPHEVQQDSEGIHLARSLSHRLLVIKYADGQIVPFYHTADDDSLDMGVREDKSPLEFFGRRMSSCFTHLTACLMRQSQNRLQSSIKYSLQIGANSTGM